MFDIVRLIIYSVLLYNIYYTASGWVTLGFASVFAVAELLLYFITEIERKISELLALAKSRILSEKPPRDSFGAPFSSTALTEEEKDLAKEVKNGDMNAAKEFLALRCEDSSIDFDRIPPQVLLIVAEKLISAIEHDQKSSEDWDDLVNDN